MVVNHDFLTIEDKKKIRLIQDKYSNFSYQIGQRCGVKDKGYWSKIYNCKRPVPPHVRQKINIMFMEENIT